MNTLRQTINPIKVKISKITLTALVFLGLLVAMVSAFTINAPNFVFVASHGGNVSFARSFTTSQWGIVDTLTGLYNIRWLGITVGRMGFDAATGVAINVTSITMNQVIYTPTYAAGGVAYIQKLDSGEPTSVTGGTATAWDSVNEITTITADLSGGAVTVRWDPERNSLLNSLIAYISIASMIPAVAGAVYLMGLLQGGEFDPKVVVFIVGMIVAFVIIAAILSSAI